jgi:oligoribonuclease NrnB/cAMP/cGMP phosphodiesterase (DHH superfamily)
MVLQDDGGAAAAAYTYSRYKEVSPALVINYIRRRRARIIYMQRAAKENTERALFIFVVDVTREENFVSPCIIVLYYIIIIIILYICV